MNITITNLTMANGTDGNGGAITTDGSFLTITNCNFTNNTASNAVGLFVV